MTRPPICKIPVEVSANDSPLTRGLPASFDVEDEPYFIELQDPGSTRILLTADYGAGATSPAIGTLYASDTSLQPNGRTRVLGYTREVGNGGVTYLLSAIVTISPSAWPGPSTPRTRRRSPFRGSWETDAFVALLPMPLPGVSAPDRGEPDGKRGCYG